MLPRRAHLRCTRCSLCGRKDESLGGREAAAVGEGSGILLPPARSCFPRFVVWNQCENDRHGVLVPDRKFRAANVQRISHYVILRSMGNTPTYKMQGNATVR